MQQQMFLIKVYVEMTTGGEEVYSMGLYSTKAAAEAALEQVSDFINDAGEWAAHFTRGAEARIIHLSLDSDMLSSMTQMIADRKKERELWELECKNEPV